jgi:hypothetical protein
MRIENGFDTSRDCIMVVGAVLWNKRIAAGGGVSFTMCFEGSGFPFISQEDSIKQPTCIIILLNGYGKILG